MKERILKRFNDEIATLERELKVELPKEIQRARELGDLRENAEYKAAKERQDIVNARIAMLKKRVGEISLMNMERIPHGKAGFGSTVELRTPQRRQDRLSAGDARRGRRREGHDLDLVANRPGHPQQRRRRRDSRNDANGGKKTFDLIKLTTIHDERRGRADARVTSYSPERRTALVLTGTGAHGAYHAGVLRALQEAGVKIDLLAGHGIGAGSAALAALDGAARLWDPSGIWRSRATATLMRMALADPRGRRAQRCADHDSARSGCRAARRSPGVLVGFVLEMLQVRAAATVVSLYSAWLQSAFAGPNLPTTVPRAATIVLVAIIAVLLTGGVLAGRSAGGRRERGGWWWRIVRGAAVRRWCAGVVCEGDLGVDSWGRASRAAIHPVLGRRYSEVLVENLGQPGFRELVLVATDLDARQDIIAALLAEPHRRDFLAPRVGRDRRSEVLDLAGVGRDHALDLVLAGRRRRVCATPRALIAFAPDSYWRGETHRACDRPGAVHRLLEEVAAAGARQAIVVSAVAPWMRLIICVRRASIFAAGSGSRRALADAVALRDALEAMSLHFDAIYVIQPVHNPIGPYDVAGAYDEASDRRQDVSELLERAYEDAYRQFIEPVVGASGEQLARTRLTTHRGAGELKHP